MTNEGSQAEIGMLVITADGHELGRVKTLSNTCIKIDVLLGPDYWIGRELIADTSTGAVFLRKERDYFNQRPTRSPVHEGLHLDEIGDLHVTS